MTNDDAIRVLKRLRETFGGPGKLGSEIDAALRLAAEALARSQETEQLRIERDSWKRAGQKSAIELEEAHRGCLQRDDLLAAVKEEIEWLRPMLATAPDSLTERFNRLCCVVEVCKPPGPRTDPCEGCPGGCFGAQDPEWCAYAPPKPERFWRVFEDAGHCWFWSPVFADGRDAPAIPTPTRKTRAEAEDDGRASGFDEWKPSDERNK